MMRRIPKFLLGFLTGIALSMFVVVFLCNYLIFQRPENYYESPVLLLYVGENEPGYAEFELLNSPEYWEEMSIAAEKEAEDFLKKKGREEDVHVHCVGRAQGYKVYYSYPRATSLRNWNSQDEVETVIMDFIHASYHSDLDKILGEDSSD
jgi:hypothetical protein